MALTVLTAPKNSRSNQSHPLMFVLLYFPEKDVKMLCELSDELHMLLEKQGLLGKNYKQRSRILKAIFKMLDLDEPKLLLRLARLILAVSLLA